MFNIISYRIGGFDLKGAKGRIITNNNKAIIRFRNEDHVTTEDLEETIDFLLKKAEKGINELPTILDIIKEESNENRK